MPRLTWKSTFLLALLICSLGFTSLATAADFEQFVKPILTKNCVKCHGGKKVKGKVNFKLITSAKQFLAKPKLIKEMFEAIDANEMPPEDEPQLDPKTREKLLAVLKQSLRLGVKGQGPQKLHIRRLNRFQYNNTIKDIFQLKTDIFPLPEKLMTRYDAYLNNKSKRMPETVNVASNALSPTPGLKGVKAFPKDLRASHGYDNQANQLTLSPLLLDSFLRLSVSILDSPDFNPSTVGVWNKLFKQPKPGTDLPTEIRNRLAWFLKRTFRRPVPNDILNRYTAYALAKIKTGLPFTAAIKKVASAALSSPLFLFRSGYDNKTESQYQLASKLSYFLWASCPDDQLLLLAERGQLAKPDTLKKTIARMIADPKIERFLDTFPAQWMQLENALAATPDPKIYKLFSLDKSHPASLQMILEPLLLFDTVFVENRNIIELISPKFTYQSEFLKTWYTSDLKVPKLDTSKLIARNKLNDQRRQNLTVQIKSLESKRAALTAPIKAKIVAARKKQSPGRKVVDLKPYAAWEFNGNLQESIRSLDLTAHGNIKFENGMVILNRAYLLSKKLPINLKAKTLEVWFKIPNLDQRGGGLMGIQGPGDFFDTIVIGERKPRHWISGSNRFARTDDFPGSKPETKANQMLHLTMVYADDGTTTLYRNGQPYARPFRKGRDTFPKNRSSVIFGLRHLPAGGNRYLNVTIDKARLYDRALTPEEVSSSSGGINLYITDKQLATAMSPAQLSQKQSITKAIEQAKRDLKQVPPPVDIRKRQQAQTKLYENEIRAKMRSRTFKRVPTSDPRFGGIITNAAMLSMTSGPKRTHPIARGAWIIEVIFNDPPPPPPNDVPPLNEDAGPKNLTIREKFIEHRKNPDCAGCHAKLDPLGFALENFDITGRWRARYPNGRNVDSTGTLLRKYPYKNIVQFKASITKEKKRFARAFTGHLLRFALSRELTPADSLIIDAIVNKAQSNNYKLQSILRSVILSRPFLQME